MRAVCQYVAVGNRWPRVYRSATAGYRWTRVLRCLALHGHRWRCLDRPSATRHRRRRFGQLVARFLPPNWHQRGDCSRIGRYHRGLLLLGSNRRSLRWHCFCRVCRKRGCCGLLFGPLLRGGRWRCAPRRGWSLPPRSTHLAVGRPVSAGEILCSYSLGSIDAGRRPTYTRPTAPPDQELCTCSRSALHEHVRRHPLLGHHQPHRRRGCSTTGSPTSSTTTTFKAAAAECCHSDSASLLARRDQAQVLAHLCCVYAPSYSRRAASRHRDELL